MMNEAMYQHQAGVSSQTARETKQQLNTHEPQQPSGTFRAYDPRRDEKELLAICKDVYNGRDYLPRVISHFVESETDFPTVLTTDTPQMGVVAVGNCQMMDEDHGWIQVGD